MQLTINTQENWLRLELMKDFSPKIEPMQSYLMLNSKIKNKQVK